GPPTPFRIPVTGAPPPACGSLLMDTGVTAMYLTVPATQAPDAIRTTSGRSPTLVDGTRIAISVPTEASAQALYAFTLGQGGNPLAPAGLHLVSLVRPPFVNTSVHFLNGFDYLYDAGGGFVGFTGASAFLATTGAFFFAAGFFSGRPDFLALDFRAVFFEVAITPPSEPSGSRDPRRCGCRFRGRPPRHR